MKRLAVISVLIFYSLASFGVSVNYFYCCGELKEISFSAHAAAENCSPDKNAKKCCQNQSVTIHMHADQKGAEYNSITVKRSVVAVPVDFDIVPKNFSRKISFQAEKYTTPPLLPLPSKQVLFCSYLI